MVPFAEEHEDSCTGSGGGPITCLALGPTRSQRHRAKMPQQLLVHCWHILPALGRQDQWLSDLETHCIGLQLPKTHFLAGTCPEGLLQEIWHYKVLIPKEFWRQYWKWVCFSKRGLCWVCWRMGGLCGTSWVIFPRGCSEQLGTVAALCKWCSGKHKTYHHHNMLSEVEQGSNYGTRLPLAGRKKKKNQRFLLHLSLWADIQIRWKHHNFQWLTVKHWEWVFTSEFVLKYSLKYFHLGTSFWIAQLSVTPWSIFMCRLNWNSLIYIHEYSFFLKVILREANKCSHFPLH